MANREESNPIRLLKRIILMIKHYINNVQAREIRITDLSFLISGVPLIVLGKNKPQEIKVVDYKPSRLLNISTLCWALYYWTLFWLLMCSILQ